MRIVEPYTGCPVNGWVLLGPYNVAISFDSQEKAKVWAEEWDFADDTVLLPVVTAGNVTSALARFEIEAQGLEDEVEDDD